MRKNIVFALSLSVVLIGFQALAKDKVPEYCQTSREYITTLEYLKDHQKQYGLEDQQTKRIAMKVAEGCSGAAKRFIKVLRVMSKAEVGTREGVQLAIDLAKKGEMHARIFVDVFKRSFLKSYLDLDLTTSVKIAKMLALTYEGNVAVAGSDFQQIVKFCLDQDEVGLAIPTCALTSAEVSSRGEHWKDGVARDFVKAYEFMRSGRGVGMPVGDALSAAAKVVENGPHSVENFIAAYKYGTSDDGLAMTADESMKFANGLVSKTVRWVEPKTDRKPAGLKRFLLGPGY